MILTRKLYLQGFNNLSSSSIIVDISLISLNKDRFLTPCEKFMIWSFAELTIPTLTCKRTSYNNNYRKNFSGSRDNRGGSAGRDNNRSSFGSNRDNRSGGSDNRNSNNNNIWWLTAHI